MSRSLVLNPAWTTEVIARSWDTITHHVPPAWLPLLTQVSPLGTRDIMATAREYGCGSYGCVYPTMEPNVVLKITTDDTEAEFAAHLSPTLIRPICTEYYRVAQLEMKHQGRPVYLLWRQDATLVGTILEVIEQDMGADEAERAADLLNTHQHADAQIAYAILKGAQDQILGDKAKLSGFMSYQREALQEGDPVSALNNWTMAVAELAVCGIPILEPLFQGILDVYNEQHIFFGDLHQGNFGAVTTPEGVRWVITDPGHVAVVDF